MPYSPNVAKLLLFPLSFSVKCDFSSLMVKAVTQVWESCDNAMAGRFDSRDRNLMVEKLFAGNIALEEKYRKGIGKEMYRVGRGKHIGVGWKVG